MQLFLMVGYREVQHRIKVDRMQEASDTLYYWKTKYCRRLPVTKCCLVHVQSKYVVMFFVWCVMRGGSYSFFPATRYSLLQDTIDNVVITFKDGGVSVKTWICL
jgi:hypothetical protein